MGITEMIGVISPMPFLVDTGTSSELGKTPSSMKSESIFSRFQMK